MQTKPAFPLLVIDGSGYFDLLNTEVVLSKCKTLGLIEGFYKTFKAYDENGTVWTVENVDSKYPINQLTKLLAYSFYNPSIRVTFSWKKMKTYHLDELKKNINTLVDKDDDVITQYMEGGFIKKAIIASQSFTDIIQVLNSYVFKVNEDEFHEEQDT